MVSFEPASLKASGQRLGPAEFGELSILVVAETGCQRRIPRLVLVLQSRLPICRGKSRFRLAPSVCSPRFPQLWKTLWKTLMDGWGEGGMHQFLRICRRRRWVLPGFTVFAWRWIAKCPWRRHIGKGESPAFTIFLVILHGNEHLGPDPRPRRNKS